MAEIFVSYSRRNKPFVKRLVKALNENGYPPEEIWVDWEDIPPASKWRNDIRNGIEAANSAIFVLSPEWAVSKECLKEYQIASEYHKRLFPIVCKDVATAELPDELRQLNWIRFRKTDNFKRSLKDLLNALTTDLDWRAKHTEILRRANEWETRGRDQGAFLRGTVLQDAESWLGQASESKQPRPTPLQRELIIASRKDHEKRQRRNFLWVSTALVISLLLAIAAIISGLEALKQSQRALASQLAAQSTNLVDTQPDLSLLLSLESNYIGDQLDESDPAWLGSLITSLNSSPKLGTFLRAHEGDVRSVAFSPDSKWLASTGNPSNDSGQAILWDMSSRINPKPFQIFTGGTKRLLSIAFSADSRIFAAAGDDKTVFIWSPTKCCSPIAQWTVNSEVRALAFAKIHGLEYIAVAEGSQVTFWNLSTETKDDSLTLKTPVGDGDEETSILSMAVNPIKNLLAVGGRNGYITAWNLNTGKPVLHQCSYGEPENDNGSLTCNASSEEITDIRGIAFNNDGRLLISGSADSRAWLWNVASGELLARSAQGNGGGHINTVTGVAFNPQNNDMVATMSWDNTVRLWEIEQGNAWSFVPVDTLAGHSSSIWSTAFSPDGKWLASASSDKTVILWKVNQASQIGSSIAKMEGNVWALAKSEDAKQFAAGDEAGNIVIWEFDGQKPVKTKTFSHPGKVNALAYSHDNKWLASAGDNGTILVQDVKTGVEAWRIENAHEDEIWSLAFSTDDARLASASFDQTVKLWDTTTKKQIGDPFIHEDEMFALTFNENETQLFVAGYNTNIYRWDLTKPASSQTPNLLQGHSATVNALAFNHAFPTLLASTSDDKTLLIWNALTGEHTSKVLGLNESMEAVTFNPSGDWLASATNNNTVLLWQLESEKCSLAWDANACQPVMLGKPLFGHSAPVNNVIFLSDTKLVSSSADGELILWNLDKSFWYQHACNIVNRTFDETEKKQYIEDKVNSPFLNVVTWFAEILGSSHGTASPDCLQ